MWKWLLVLVLLPADMLGQSVGWQVQELLRFSDAPPDIAFARINDLAVDGEGHLYVLDGLNSEIYVFGHDGAYLRTIGRRGAGPGELSNAVMHIAVAGSQVAVADLGNQRISVFGQDGTRHGDFPSRTMETGIVMGLGGLPDGSLLVQRDPVPRPPQLGGSGVAPAAVLLRMDAAGAVLDTVYRFAYRPMVEFDGGRMRTRFPDALPAWVVDQEGRVAIAQTDRYVIRRWHAGAIRDSMVRDVRRLPMTEEFRTRILRQRDSMVAEAAAQRGAPRMEIDMVFPDSFPVMGRIDPGPFGTILVWRAPGQLLDGPTDGLTADVFDGERRFLGTWELPRGFRLLAARDDRVYGVELDADDLPYVVVYRVTR